MINTPFDVGVLVLGAPTSPRALVLHEGLLTAYATGEMNEQGEDREAYLSHYVFGREMRKHYAENNNSVAGFAGPCWCRWLVLDIDRGGLADALADARKLVRFIHGRYPSLEDCVPIYFSGGKGFHVLIELAHRPPPAVGFHAITKTFTLAIARAAGVTVDPAIYDANHIVRLPNTRHPRTGLFKRRLDAEALFCLDIEGILETAKHPDCNGMPTAGDVPPQLVTDWQEAELVTLRQEEARAAVRRDVGTSPDIRAPKYFMDLLRFGIEQGERHQTLFRAAAWLTEQGAPPPLCHALLTEAGLDVGLAPKDVERQIRCGITHGRRQQGEGEPPPENRGDAWEAPSDRLTTIDPAALAFDYGANANGLNERRAKQ